MSCCTLTSGGTPTWIPLWGETDPLLNLPLEPWLPPHPMGSGHYAGPCAVWPLRFQSSGSQGRTGPGFHRGDDSGGPWDPLRPGACREGPGCLHAAPLNGKLFSENQPAVKFRPPDSEAETCHRLAGCPCPQRPQFPRHSSIGGAQTHCGGPMPGDGGGMGWAGWASMGSLKFTHAGALGWGP